MGRRTLTISRYWNNPKIETVINDESIGLTIDYDRFLEALLQETGSVLLTLTKTQFKNQLLKASERVLEKIKEESIKTV